MKAMLAYNKIPKLEEIRLPKLVSDKMDGIRCLMVNGVAMSRNNKPIPNKWVQQSLGWLNLHGLDGELMLKEGDFNDAQSAFMSQSGQPNFYYAVFDSFLNLNRPFSNRLCQAQLIVTDLDSPLVEYVKHTFVEDITYLDFLYEHAIADGYEGLILRDPDAPYKQGRSTFKQQWMMKLKPEEDAEGIIVGFEELMHNTDTSTKKLENMVGGDTLGAFLIKWKDKTLHVGTGKGLTHERRKHFWVNREKYLGKTMTFAYQELSKYGVPRFPRFKGIRGDL